MSLDRHDLLDALRQLGRRAFEVGKIIDLAVYGGSCLMLVSNFRDASQDIDAVAATDQRFIDELAAEIGAQRGWRLDQRLCPGLSQPERRLSGQPQPGRHLPIRKGARAASIRSDRGMLAMKLMSLRIDAAQGEKDRRDIANLLTVLGIDSKSELIRLASDYYPEAKVSPKLLLAADRIVKWDDVQEIEGETPRYLDRSGGDRRR